MAHILIRKDETCTCSCTMKCVVTKKVGSTERCTREEIEAVGHTPIIAKKSIFGFIKLLGDKLEYLGI